MRYSRRTSNYPETITLPDPTHMITMAHLVAIVVEKPRTNSGCSLKKEFTKLIHMNSQIVLYLIINQVDSCHSCVRDPFNLRHQRHLVDG